MKTWNDFSIEEPEVAEIGKNLLFQSREHVGLAFIATLRKDDAQDVVEILNRKE